MRSAFFTCFVAALAACLFVTVPAALAQSATLSVPAEVTVGAEIPVTWTGPDAKGDFISLDSPGAAENHYGRYQYASKGSPLKLRAPGEPGSWVVRYHSGESGYAVLATAKVEVVPTTATLTVPATAGIGEKIDIGWTGPDHRGDFISVDTVGAPDNQYGTYAYTSRGSPAQLVMPGEPGQYEIRYHLGAAGYAVIGSATIEVGATSATLTFDSPVAAGSNLSITWDGPNNRGDFISIDPVGAAPGDYGDYAYVARGNPVEIQVPDDAGTYQVRYHIGSGGYPAIGAAPLQVGGVTATVSVAGQVVADEPFEVEWTGPDNRGDFVTIVPVGTEDGEWGPYAYTVRGNPLRVRAPVEPGPHEVRYVTGRQHKTLASVPVDVTPGQAKGTLKVFLSSQGAAAGSGAAPGAAPGTAPGAIQVILDASGSMLQRLDGTRRIELAREALLSLTGESLPENVPFALRVFGHKEADSCRTDLEIPLGPLDRGQAAQTLRGVNAMNLAKTPIADSLRLVKNDLAGAGGSRLVILVTDGEETCGGDPAAVIEELKDSGIDVRINIVGFAIDELMVKEQFESWARLGGGRYFDAADGDALAGAVKGALATTYDVVSGGEVVATGSLDGQVLELEPGDYQIRVGGQDVGTVKVVAKEETLFTVDG